MDLLKNKLLFIIITSLTALSANSATTTCHHPHQYLQTITHDRLTVILSNCDSVSVNNATQSVEFRSADGTLRALFTSPTGQTKTYHSPILLKNDRIALIQGNDIYVLNSSAQLVNNYYVDDGRMGVWNQWVHGFLGSLVEFADGTLAIASFGSHSENKGRVAFLYPNGQVQSYPQQGFIHSVLSLKIILQGHILVARTSTGSTYYLNRDAQPLTPPQ